MNILIVDDTSSDRLLLTMYLSKLGHNVSEASDGEQAIDKYKQGANDIDLILMDVLMPVMGGFEAVVNIRNIQESRHLEWVPIIFLSASAEADDIEEGILAGGDDYLIKPIHQKVLSAKMLAMQRIADMRNRLIQVNSILAEKAATDHLTGVLNRRAFDAVLDREVARAKRVRLSFSFALFDLDYFKQVNDNYGHDTGDFVLKEIADRISKGLRSDDVLARVGGEEFGVFLSNAVGDNAQLACERYRKLVASEPVIYKGIRIPITVSVGFSAFHMENDTRLSLCKKADIALYKAKDAGRNCVIQQE